MRTNAIAPISGIFLALALFAAQVHASTTLSFYGITSSDSTGFAVQDGVASLQVEIIDIGNNQVRFLFTNDSDASSLTDVYFDDGALLGISEIRTSSSGVSFARGASPPNLPGGNALNPDFETTAGFLADSNSPVIGNGVQDSDITGEWLAIEFDLKNNKTYNDVLAALTLPEGGDWLRIGLHVQGYKPSGGTTTYSESFINSTFVSAVPEIQSHAMILLGIGLVAMVIRRREKR